MLVGHFVVGRHAAQVLRGHHPGVGERHGGHAQGADHVAAGVAGRRLALVASVVHGHGLVGQHYSTWVQLHSCLWPLCTWLLVFLLTSTGTCLRYMDRDGDGDGDYCTWGFSFLFIFDTLFGQQVNDASFVCVVWRSTRTCRLLPSIILRPARRNTHVKLTSSVSPSLSLSVPLTFRLSAFDWHSN